MQNWLKKLEKRDSNPTKKAKDTKLREFFEKQFPELRKQREDKERLSRAGQRIRSDADLEDIMDGLQEQELEDKKMRSYAVIPPILNDTRHPQFLFINRNGLCEDPLTEYKELLEIDQRWTASEKEIFREKFLITPKNFGVISTFLDRKTVADCVKYYYHSKKSENYKMLLRKHVKKRTRALARQQQQQAANAAAAAAAAAQQQQQNASRSTQHEDLLKVRAMTPAIGAAVTSGDTSSALARQNNNGPDVSLKDLKKEGEALGDEARQVSGGNASPDGPPCCVCKIPIKNMAKSRPVTDSNCHLYAIPVAELSESTRVCSTCRLEFNGARKQCPVPSCKTPRRSVRRLRSLPLQWQEMNPDLRRAYSEMLEFPLDVQKCCFRCVMRVSRRIGAVSPSLARTTNAHKKCPDTTWKEEEIEQMKRALREYGKDWPHVSTAIPSKSIKECRTFYFNYKYKLKLDQLIRLFHDSRGHNAPAAVDSDSEEFWNEITDADSEDTSSADEGNGRSNSDTASAPSPPPNKNGANPTASPAHVGNSVATSAGVSFHEHRLQDLKGLCASQASLKSDYDSSATMSADESVHGEGERRSASPSLPRANSVSTAYGQSHPYTPQTDRFITRPASHEAAFGTDADIKSHQTSMPPRQPEGLIAQRQRVPAFLINPNAPTSMANSMPRPPPEADAHSGKEEPTCVRDLIYQAIEMSLQTPLKPGNKPGGSSSPSVSSASIPYSVYDRRDQSHQRPIYPVEVKHEPGLEKSRVAISPSGMHDMHARHGYPQPNIGRPEGLASMMSYSQIGASSPQNDNEVQDLSKKSTPSDSQRGMQFQRKDSPLTVTSRDYGYGAMAPPPAHSKHSNKPSGTSQAQQDALSAEAMQREYYARQAQQKMLYMPERSMAMNNAGMARPPPRTPLNPSGKPQSLAPPPPLITSGMI